MKKILLSLITIVCVGTLVGVGATGAFLSDSETSVGNTFTAGAIDLKVDNESYYNGNVCVENPLAGANEPNQPYWIWQGNAPYPVPGTACTTSFELDDLDKGLLFFNFRDLKPDDEGEDTISLHVNNNDAYTCMDMTLTSNDDISSNEPELDTTDPPENPNDTWDGEIGDLVKMIWWVDDGDNVLEEGESLLNGGVKSIKDFFGGDNAFSADLADATTNVWTNQPGPVIGGQDYYIAKAWCFGTMAENRVVQDNLGKTGTNGPMVRGTGISCDGKTLGNESQTDGATLDVAFRVVQARHNASYTCGDEQPRTAKLTVIKNVVNTPNGGNNVVADFQLKVVGTVVTNVTSGVETTFAADNYVVTETGISGYQAVISGDCNAAGQITLAPGDVKTCTVTNTALPGNITLIKSVINDNGGLLVDVQFPLLIDGGNVPNNTSVAVTANSAHTINETQQSGYHFVSITGSAKCPGVLGGTATLDEGEAITCTIRNSDNGGAL